MNIEVSEHNIARNLAYQKFPEFVAAMKRKNIYTVAKELHETGGMSDREYTVLLRKLLKAEGVDA